MRPHLRHTYPLTVGSDGTQPGQLVLINFPVLPETDNSLRNGTGNLFRPSRELNRASGNLFAGSGIPTLAAISLRRKPGVRALGHDEQGGGEDALHASGA